MSYEKFEISDLEQQYSPSKWSIRDSAENVLKCHLDYVTKASLETKQLIPNQQGIPTGEGSNQKIDIFGTHLPNEAPWFVYIHGGYWQELSRELSSYPVQPLVSEGICTVIAGYDLCPNVSLSKIIEQIKQTSRFCIEKAYEKGARSITFCGHSAGAHLASILSQRDFLSSLPFHLQSIVKGFCLISGVFDVSPLIYTTVNDKLSLSNKDAKLLSPIFGNYENINDIKIIIAVGQYDSPAFKLQSEEFYKKMNSIFNHVQYMLVEGYDHFNIVEDLFKNDYVLTKTIVRNVLS